jgi:hypothetical protein
MAALLLCPMSLGLISGSVHEGRPAVTSRRAALLGAGVACVTIAAPGPATATLPAAELEAIRQRASKGTLQPDRVIGRAMRGVLIDPTEAGIDCIQLERLRTADVQGAASASQRKLLTIRDTKLIDQTAEIVKRIETQVVVLDAAYKRTCQ